MLVGGATVNLTLQFSCLKSILIFFLQISSGSLVPMKTIEAPPPSNKDSQQMAAGQCFSPQQGAPSEQAQRCISCGKSIRLKANLVKHVESHLTDLQRLCGG